MWSVTRIRSQTVKKRNRKLLTDSHMHQYVISTLYYTHLFLSFLSMGNYISNCRIPGLTVNEPGV